LTPLVWQTGRENELADQLGHQAHRHGRRTVSSAQVAAGEDHITSTRPDHEDAETVASDVNHGRGRAGDGRRRLLSAIAPARSLSTATVAESVHSQAAARPETPRQ
jgi:hypothetical protein